MKLYKIRDWAALFENNRSRVVIELSWVPIPNRHDGENFSRIVAHPQGAEIFAAWILLLQVASRCQPRGTLLRDNRQPHDSQSLALKTRAPSKWFDLAFDFLEKNTDWLEIVSDCHQGDGAVTAWCHQPDVKVPPNEGKGTERREGKTGVGVGVGTGAGGPPAQSLDDPPLVRLITTMNTAYQRSPKQAWNYADEEAAVSLLRRQGWAADLELVLSHRRKLSPDDRRFYAPSVFSCLSKFDEWLDKARAQKSAPIKSTPPAKAGRCAPG